MNLASLAQPPTQSDLRSGALDCLCLSVPDSKAASVAALGQAWHEGTLQLACAQAYVPALELPGRPAKPDLVPPLQVQRRSMRTLEGRAALIHALAHIEFNAINLALDAIWRFADMPAAYYTDWLRVAVEEALHFNLLSRHLQKLGFNYGDFPSHGSLWDMVEKTRDDVLARMALVPRTLEARGLDASPAVRAKLAQAGDQDAALILDLILRDEIGHVAIGNHWFGWLCAQRGLDPLDAYRGLSIRYKAPTLRPPFNLDARRLAGFSEAELDQLGR